MDLVVSAAPLSQPYRESLERRSDAPVHYETLSSLRSRSLILMLRALFAHRGSHVWLAIEDEGSRALLPILHLVALAALPRTLELVDEQVSVAPISQRRALGAIAALARGSVRGLWAAGAARRELRTLLGEPRIDGRLPDVSRMLYLNANLWFGVKVGGSVGHMTGVVNALDRAGIAVDLASPIRPSLIRRARGINLPVPPLGFPFELNHYAFQKDLLSPLSRLTREPYSFIYQRLSVHNYAGVVLSRRRRIPLIVEYNGSEVWVANHWGKPLRYEQLARRAEEVMLRHAHVVVTVSEVLRDELIERGVEPSRIAYYPNCVDPTIFSPKRFPTAEIADLRVRHRIPQGAVVVAFVGTFGRWHGVEVLAEAIHRIVDSAPGWLRERNVRFMIVGDGARMPVVLRLLGDSCKEFVILTGVVPQERVPAYLAAADILVSPHVPNPDNTAFFGSPTKLFEYMAMARLIVASDLGQIGDVLRPALRAQDLPEQDPPADDRNLAILAQPGSVDELLAALRFAVDRPLWRQSLGTSARAAVVARFTWDHHVDVVLGVLRRVAGA